jgi:hypothetical protein
MINKIKNLFKKKQAETFIYTDATGGRFVTYKPITKIVKENKFLSAKSDKLSQALQEAKEYKERLDSLAKEFADYIENANRVEQEEFEKYHFLKSQIDKIYSILDECQDDNNRLASIRLELKKAGYTLSLPKDDDKDWYNQMVGINAYEVCKCFCRQGHSGMSANFTIYLITKLLKGELLSPLTNDPDEWNDVTGMSNEKLYQSKRRSSCFTKNMTTYYDIDDEDNMIFELDDKGERTGGYRLKQEMKQIPLEKSCKK